MGLKLHDWDMRNAQSGLCDKLTELVEGVTMAVLDIAHSSSMGGERRGANRMEMRRTTTVETSKLL